MRWNLEPPKPSRLSLLQVPSSLHPFIPPPTLPTHPPHRNSLPGREYKSFSREHQARGQSNTSSFLSGRHVVSQR
ncbi:unnamed protein product, partial [Ectocarpus sp. 12 AP-2014]